ncbi:MAG: helix-turn-helix transcriptional regulator [Allosphingosinicella sp.]|uniref:helix-turn-helix transcriptional regulator n=1 Tax=Allosphingosinicella sp. TaxID=2823234 RepID=UPI003934C7EE
MRSIQDGHVANPVILLQRWIAQERRPRMMVDQSLSIIWANATAKLALEARQCLSYRGGRLSALGSARQQQLESWLATLTVRPSRLFLSIDDESVNHVVMTGQLLAADAGARFFGISFCDTRTKSSLLLDDLDQPFGLTRAEHCILRYLLSGSQVADIADDKGLSPETVRSHVRSIYAKLQVNSRERLFQRLQPYLT